MSKPNPKPKRRYKRYSSQFKREALLRASEEGMTDKAVCDELGVSTRQFRRWRDELALLGKEAFPGTGVTRDQERVHRRAGGFDGDDRGVGIPAQIAHIRVVA